MRDKLNINIRLANYPPMSLKGITPQEEETARLAETNINSLWREWCRLFKDKSADEVMAIVAFRFADLYFRKVAAMEALQERMAAFEKTLDGLLASTGDDDAAAEC